MSDKRTGKKKKKVHPVVTEETPNKATETPVIVPKKTKKSSKS